ncbi:DMT family transporter [Acinetobacter baumannii]|nr:DMT family transporter [Acinetobacter baumannii]
MQLKLKNRHGVQRTLTGQVSKSLIIDHYGLLGTPHRKVDRKRVVALIFIVAALVLVAKA